MDSDLIYLILGFAIGYPLFSAMWIYVFDRLIWKKKRERLYGR